MRFKFSVPAAAVVGIAFAMLAPAAQAAPTRDDYLAQIEPICQNSLSGYQEMHNRGLADLKARHLKKAGLKLLVAAGIYRNTFESVQQVQPTNADVPLISAWLKLDLREAELQRRFGMAIGTDHAIKAAKLAGRAENVDAMADDLMAGYGIVVCD